MLQFDDQFHQSKIILAKFQVKILVSRPIILNIQKISIHSMSRLLLNSKDITFAVLYKFYLYIYLCNCYQLVSCLVHVLRGGCAY